MEDNGSLTRVAAFPIGIDPDRFVRSLERPDVRSNIAKLLTRYAGRKVGPVRAYSSCPGPHTTFTILYEVAFHVKHLFWWCSAQACNAMTTQKLKSLHWVCLLTFACDMVAQISTEPS